MTEWTTVTLPQVWAGEPRLTLYQDQDHIPLSQAQLQVFGAWQYEDTAASPSNDSECPDSVFRQGPVANCSLVASLTCIAEHTLRGHGDLLRKVFFPYDDKLERPAISQNSRYAFRFYINGAYRRVCIDGRLPKSTVGQPLHTVLRQMPTLSWPGLLEKAVLKVSGGYDFSGSDSATDLLLLAGWLPESTHLQR